MVKRLTFVSTLLLCAGVSHALAAEFPLKQPIRIVVGANPGGGTDVLARITAEALQRRLGQPVVVLNKPGAGASLAVDQVAKAAPDGHTLLLIFNELVALAAVRNNLPYKVDELTFLIRPFTYQPMLFGSPKKPYASATDLVAAMKANPGNIKYGSTGVGAVIHLGLAMFESATGTKGLHVPYTGIAPVYQDLLAGTIDFAEGTPPSLDGVKALASVGPKRSHLFPNVPTLEEMGIKGATWEAWSGFLAPPNLPKPIADRLIAEIDAVIKDPETIAKYQASGKVTPDAQPLTGEAFKKAALDELKRWKVVVDREKIVIE